MIGGQNFSDSNFYQKRNYFLTISSIDLFGGKVLLMTDQFVIGANLTKDQTFGQIERGSPHGFMKTG